MSSISAPFIKRPVATTLLTIAVVLGGSHGVYAASRRAAAADRLPDHLRERRPARAEVRK